MAQYIKFIPGKFLFDRSTGFIYQVLLKYTDPEKDINVLYITKPAKSLANASIPATEWDLEKIEVLVNFAKTFQIKKVIGKETITSLVVSSTVINTDSPEEHKFLRPCSFFKNYWVDEGWVKKNLPDMVSKSWSVFQSKWEIKDMGGFNFKMANKEPYISQLLHSIKKIIEAGDSNLFSLTEPYEKD